MSLTIKLKEPRQLEGVHLEISARSATRARTDHRAGDGVAAREPLDGVMVEVTPARILVSAKHRAGGSVR